jgi:hypothetical protein
MSLKMSRNNLTLFMDACSAAESFLIAAEQVRAELIALRDDLDANDLTAAAAHRISGILRDWDGTP